MKHQVIVQLRDPASCLVISPLFELDAAQQELEKVRRQQESADLTDLDWLSVHGTQILSAHIEPLMPKSVRHAA